MKYRNGETFEIAEGRAYNNGLMLGTSDDKGFVVLATINDEQNVETEILPKKIAEQKMNKVEKENEQFNKLIDNTMKVIFVVLMLTCALPPMILSYMDYDVLPAFVQGLIVDPVEGTLDGCRILLIDLLITIITFIKAGEYMINQEASLCRFHAAEHMAYNACKKLKRIPTILELSEFSRFCNCCSSNILELIVIMCIVGILYLVTGMSTFVCACIILIAAIACVTGVLNYGQLVVTKKPTARELTVAIVALDALYEWKKNQENNFS